jgi:hypothetical protein
MHYYTLKCVLSVRNSKASAFWEDAEHQILISRFSFVSLEAGCLATLGRTLLKLCKRVSWGYVEAVLVKAASHGT